MGTRSETSYDPNAHVHTILRYAMFDDSAFCGGQGSRSVATYVAHIVAACVGGEKPVEQGLGAPER